MSVCVLTGASGFLGSAIRRKASPEVLFCADAVSADPDVQAIDLLDKDAPAHLPDRIDEVIHLAAISSDPACRANPLLAWEMNLLATLRLYEAAAARGCRKFLFSSTEWVYGDTAGIRKESDPLSVENLGVYALTKLAAERALLQIEKPGCEVLILRLAILYGPRKTGFSAVESIIHRVMEDTPVEVQSGKTARCYLHVEDAAEAFLLAQKTELRGVRNLTGPDLVTLADVFETACAVTGTRPPFVEKNPAVMTVRELDGTPLWNELHWRPRRLRGGVEDLLAHFQKNRKREV